MIISTNGRINIIYPLNIYEDDYLTFLLKILINKNFNNFNNLNNLESLIFRNLYSKFGLKRSNEILYLSKNKITDFLKRYVKNNKIIFNKKEEIKKIDLI